MENQVLKARSEIKGRSVGVLEYWSVGPEKKDL
jgi:hypothetical protein